ncbi:MAG: YihY/virulence factor BrkB family protein [Pirellulales bacterium]|nr:YihY/virulence factor BrkB family protein [Pirellulales bacterium]
MHKWLLKSFWPRLREAGRNWQRDDCSTLAAATAYYAAFSLLPLLLLLISALGLVLRFSSGAQNARQKLLDLVAQNASPALADHLRDVLGQISDRATVGGPIALAALLLAAIGVFAQVERAFDRIWKHPKSGRGGVWAAILSALYYRLRAFLMLLGASTIVVAAFVAGIVLSAIQAAAPLMPGGNWPWSISQIAISMSIYALFFAVIYKALPKVRVRWSHAVRGGLLAALFWEAARQALTFILLGKTYTAYGVVGSLIAVMLWIYIAANVLFLGAEYVRVLGENEDV